MSDALTTMLELAERQRDTARAALMQAEGASNRALAQLDQLVAYQADYRARAPGTAGLAAPIELLRCHQGFMGRLDQAMVQQREAVKTSHGELLRRRQQLQQAELKVASVRKLIERRQSERERVEARREQNHSDEAALQRHRRASSGFGGLA
jgi:flagellar protein FliJ